MNWPHTPSFILKYLFKYIFNIAFPDYPSSLSYSIPHSPLPVMPFLFSLAFIIFPPVVYFFICLLFTLCFPNMKQIQKS